MVENIRHNIAIKVKKKRKKLKIEGGRIGVGENISVSVYEDKYWMSCPKKSRLSSFHCKQQKHQVLESEAECLEKLGSGF